MPAEVGTFLFQGAERVCTKSGSSMVWSAADVVAIPAIRAEALEPSPPPLDYSGFTLNI